jgi:hypothetical protein
VTAVPPGIEDHPYFKWRRDGQIQLTLGLAAACVFLACAGFDAIAAHQFASAGRRVHWLFLALAGLVGGSVILQFRFTVLMLRPLCAVVCVLAALGLLRAPWAWATMALVASMVAGAAAEWRMRGAHWAEFHAYNRVPEEPPKAPVKR